MDTKICTVDGCEVERFKNPKTGRYVNGLCRECDRIRVNSIRHYCTVEKPDGTVEDWVLYQKNDLGPYRGPDGHANITDDWMQDRPGDKWPKRKELLLGVLAKSNGKPTLRTCGGECGETKPISDFNKKSAGGVQSLQTLCRDCDDRESRGSAKVRREIEVGENLTRVQYSALGTTEQRRLRAKYNNTEVKEPNNQDTSPPEPKAPKAPKEMVIPPITLVMPSTPTTPKWREGPTSKALNNNLWVKHGGCEWTGEPRRFCNEGHTVSRKLCKEYGHPEWIWDEENCTFMITQMNDAMERAGYWLTPCGRYAPPPGEDYAVWAVKLGIPDVRIQMYGKRAWFATMAMRGEIVPMFTNGEFHAPD